MGGAGWDGEVSGSVVCKIDGVGRIFIKLFVRSAKRLGTAVSYSHDRSTKRPARAIRDFSLRWEINEIPCLLFGKLQLESFAVMEQGDHPCRCEAVFVDVVKFGPLQGLDPWEGFQPRAGAVFLDSLLKKPWIVGAVFLIHFESGEEPVCVPETGDAVEAGRQVLDVEGRQGISAKLGIEIGLRHGEALGEVASTDARMSLAKLAALE